MATYEIAHIRQQGIDPIITLLDRKFGRLPSEKQSEVIAYLQECAHSAGLAGTVVPVWQEGHGHRFIAPQQWHPFFKSLSWADILTNVNKKLTCS